MAKVSTQQWVNPLFSPSGLLFTPQLSLWICGTFVFKALKAAAPVPPLSEQVAGRPTIREGLAPADQARLDEALEALGAK